MRSLHSAISCALTQFSSHRLHLFYSPPSMQSCEISTTQLHLCVTPQLTSSFLYVSQFFTCCLVNFLLIKVNDIHSLLYNGKTLTMHVNYQNTAQFFNFNVESNAKLYDLSLLFGKFNSWLGRQKAISLFLHFIASMLALTESFPWTRSQIWLPCTTLSTASIMSRVLFSCHTRLSLLMMPNQCLRCKSVMLWL